MESARERLSKRRIKGPGGLREEALKHGISTSRSNMNKAELIDAILQRQGYGVLPQPQRTSQRIEEQQTISKSNALIPGLAEPPRRRGRTDWGSLPNRRNLLDSRIKRIGVPLLRRQGLLQPPSTPPTTTTIQEDMQSWPIKPLKKVSFTKKRVERLEKQVDKITDWYRSIPLEERRAARRAMKGAGERIRAAERSIKAMVRKLRREELAWRSRQQQRREIGVESIPEEEPIPAETISQLIEDGNRVKVLGFGGKLDHDITEKIMEKIEPVIEMRAKVVLGFSARIHRLD